MEGREGWEDLGASVSLVLTEAGLVRQPRTSQAFLPPSFSR